MAQTTINGATQIAAASITQAQLNVATPTTSGQVATKGYVDAAAQGLTVKVACQAATTSALSFTISSGNVTTITGTTVDGYSPAVNDYILVKDAPSATGGGSANSSQPGNGIYIVTGNTTNLSVSRATFMNSGGDAPQGAFTFIESGTANASSGWVVSSPAADAAVTYGTTAIAWTQFSGAGEVTVDSTLTKSGNQLSRAAITGDVAISAGSNSSTIGAGAVTLAKIASAAYNTTPTASTLAEWDGNVNLSTNALFAALTSTATAAGTTTMTITSAETQVWTGTTTQTVKLPTTSVPAGAQYTIINQSSGNVSVQSSGANAILTLTGAASAPFSVGIFTALVATPTTAANWSYAQYASGTASGTVTSVSVATANGFSGTVATATSTPAITIQSNVAAGVLASSGVGGSIQAATTAQLAGGYVVRETPSGTVNGSNTAFTLANTPVSGTEMIFQNGLLLVSGSGKDYTISTNAITFVTAPATGDVLMATYWH